MSNVSHANNNTVGSTPSYLNMGTVNNSQIRIMFITQSEQTQETTPQTSNRNISRRQRTIDSGLTKLKQTSAAILDFIEFIQANRYKEPSQVDGEQLIALEEKIYQTCEALLNQIDTISFDDLINAIAGRSTWPLIIKSQIQSGNGDPTFWQKEIDTLAKKDKVTACELQLLLDQQLNP